LDRLGGDATIEEEEMAILDAAIIKSHGRKEVVFGDEWDPEQFVLMFEGPPGEDDEGKIASAAASSNLLC